MAVVRKQWGAEPWQHADLYMPDDPSPFQKEEGVPCIILLLLALESKTTLMSR